MQKQKAKITYSNANLSALAIANLTKAISSTVPITKSAKPLPENKSDIYNVELKIDNSIYYGELTIISFLINHVNNERSADNKYWSQGSSDLNYDNLLYMLNNKLRPVADAFAITAKNSEPAKDLIKLIAKELEEANTL